MAKVTYKQLEEGDPLRTKFAGFSFLAGEPVEIPENATIVVTEREVKFDSDGNERSRGVEKKVSVLKKLAENPYFVVDGVKQAQPSKRGRPALPKSPAEYRSYAQDWFQKCTTPQELGERWNAEAELRQKIGVHDDGEDISYLRPFYEARFHELTKAAA